MKAKITAIAVSALLLQPTAAEVEMQVGDGRIDGSRISPFRLSWHQCTLQEGSWIYAGSVTEEVTAIGDAVLRHRREGAQADGVSTMATTYLDRVSFSPLRMELQASGPDGTQLASGFRALTPQGYAGVVTRGSEQRQVQGAISSQMLNGGMLGLPLATLPFQKEPLEFIASMMSFDASYRVIADWVGRETLQFDGQRIEAWLVDLEWHHRELGDVYPPGPNASGGRLWLVPKPPDGFPYVPKYQTDTYVIEFTRDLCPAE